MIDQAKVQSIELVTSTENPEQSLIMLSQSSDKTLESLSDSEVMVALVKGKSESYSLKFIHLMLIVKTGEDNFLDMDLATLLEVLDNKEDINFCNLLFNAVSSKLPYFMTALGEAYDYNCNLVGSTGTIGISNSSPSIYGGSNPSTRVNSKSDVKLIDDHWKYVEEVILTATDGNEDFSIRAMEFMYRSSFKHGLKHAREE